MEFVLAHYPYGKKKRCFCKDITILQFYLLYFEFLNTVPFVEDVILQPPKWGNKKSTEKHFSDV